MHKVIIDISRGLIGEERIKDEDMPYFDHLSALAGCDYDGDILWLNDEEAGYVRSLGYSI